MKTINVEIPEGKKAEWVNGVLTLVDEQPVEFKFKVGDRVRCHPLGGDIYFNGTVVSYTNSKGAICYGVLDEKSHEIAVVDFDNCVKLIDKEPIEFKFKVGDKVRSTTDPQLAYTVTKQFVEDGKPFYELADGWGKSSSAEEWLEICTEPKDITERIKTFDDAIEWCRVNGHDNLINTWKNFDYDGMKDDDVLAYLKLRIVTCALNEGWEPTFNSCESRWRLRYNIYQNNLDCVEATWSASFVWNTSATTLYFKSKELALYAATQFKDIYMDFCYKGKE